MVSSKHLLFIIATVLAMFAIFLFKTPSYLSTLFSTEKNLRHNQQKEINSEKKEKYISGDVVDSLQLANPPLTHAYSAAGKNLLPLSSEQYFFRQGEQNITQVSKLITNNSFKKIIDELDSESARNPETAEITNIYKNETLKTIPSNLGLRLTNFACGLSVCAASFLSNSDENAFNDWYRNFQRNPNMPHSVGFDFTLAIDSKNLEHRIVFYIDSRHNSVNF